MRDLLFVERPLTGQGLPGERDQEEDKKKSDSEFSKSQRLRLIRAAPRQCRRQGRRRSAPHKAKTPYAHRHRSHEPRHKNEDLSTGPCDARKEPHRDANWRPR